MRTAFVTGSTGLLGNNLVRALVSAGYQVRALARSSEKAKVQFDGVGNVEVVVGDLTAPATFARSLLGVDILFHAGAHFRDSYKGGNHVRTLTAVNVDGTRALLEAAYAAGVRRMVHTSSIAVLRGEPGDLVDETMERSARDADDYYLSKIRAEQQVRDFMSEHPDFDATFVLPAWMWGPGDIGPTSAGTLALDIVNGKLPGMVPGSFSVVDARDVAKAQVAAGEKGERGERYLAAGRYMTMRDLVPLVGKIAEVPVPKRAIPMPVLYVMATLQEVYARVTGRPVLLSLAAVRNLAQENGRTRFSAAKFEQELGLRFRPVEETIRDTVSWYRTHEWLPAA